VAELVTVPPLLFLPPDPVILHNSSEPLKPDAFLQNSYQNIKNFVTLLGNSVTLVNTPNAIFASVIKIKFL